MNLRSVELCKTCGELFQNRSQSNLFLESREDVLAFLDIIGYNWIVIHLMSKKEELLRQVDQWQEKIAVFRPIHADRLQAVQDMLRIDWTYNSNAIEGNTLTYGETAFFLREGLTSEGKPLKDYLEAKNHAEAIDGLHEIIRGERSFTEGLIKELHGVLMKDIEFTFARGMQGALIKKPFHAGQYKLQPNHVLTLSGKIHYYTDPLHVKDEMEKLLAWCSEARDLHPVEKAAIFHYRFVTIHPFDDGNGRMARLLMNLILMQAGYPPCIVRHVRRKTYLESLEKADVAHDTSVFVQFIVEELIVTLQRIGDVLEGKVAPELSKSLVSFSQEQRSTMILGILKKEPLSIGQIMEVLRTQGVKRPTLKLDLKRLVQAKRIKRSGKGRGVGYTL